VGLGSNWACLRRHCSGGVGAEGLRLAVRATERQVPADELAAAALEKIGDGLLSILWFGQHAFDGVCRELASGDVDGHAISPDE
jgi:hypothetical protein